MYVTILFETDITYFVYIFTSTTTTKHVNEVCVNTKYCLCSRKLYVILRSINRVIVSLLKIQLPTL